MAPLFSKTDLNEFSHDVQNEVTLICAKSGKNLFSICKVISLKTKWPRFFGIPCTYDDMTSCIRCALQFASYLCSIFICRHNFGYFQNRANLCSNLEYLEKRSWDFWKSIVTALTTCVVYV